MANKIARNYDEGCSWFGNPLAAAGHCLMWRLAGVVFTWIDRAHLLSFLIDGEQILPTGDTLRVVANDLSSSAS